jgi:hypothetical protein
LYSFIIIVLNTYNKVLELCLIKYATKVKELNSGYSCN